MITSEQINKLAQVIKNNCSFLITTHVNPDADAIGSAMAVYYILKKLNKNVKIINHNETPSNISFLDPENIIEKFDIEKHSELFSNTDVLIVVDLNNLNRTISMCDTLTNFRGYKICLDHHEHPDDFADLYLLDIHYTSTGEIVYDFIKKSNLVELDEKIAEAIYAAVMTDTGSFRFDRTSSKTHLMAADLLHNGVNPKLVFEKIYEQNKIGRTNLLGDALSKLKLNSTGDICYMIITQEMLDKFDTEESDVDGFVNFCLSIENVKIGILFFELKDGMKVSFRSRTKIPVNKLAGNYGGGGHYHAAGLRLYDVDFNEMIEDILKKSEEYL